MHHHHLRFARPQECKRERSVSQYVSVLAFGKGINRKGSGSQQTGTYTLKNHCIYMEQSHLSTPKGSERDSGLPKNQENRLQNLQTGCNSNAELHFQR